MSKDSKIMRRSMARILIFCGLAVVLPLSFSKTAKSLNVVTGVFETADGNVVNLDGLAGFGRERPTLILFWAQWCEPCVRELKLISQRHSEISNINVIAISIDTRSDRSKAEVALEAMRWPYPSVFDEDGVWFSGNISADGELPKSILVDDKFNLIQRLARVDDAFLNELITNMDGLLIPNQGLALNWDGEFSYNDGTRAAAEAWTSTASFQNDDWNVSASHQVLRQQRAGNDWTRYEDQVGKTWIERNWKSANRDWSLRTRVGDQDVYELNGQLFSIRNNRATNEYSYLRGVHAGYYRSGILFNASAGLIAQRLYPIVIDPTRDLSVLTPEAKSLSASMRFLLPFSTQVALAYGHYVEMLSVKKLGVQRDEDRYGLGLSSEISRLKIDASGACYDDRSSIPDQGCLRRHSWLGSVKWRNSWRNGHSNYSDIAMLGRSASGLFTSSNSLFSDPFEPLESSGNVKEWRFGMGHSTPSFPVMELYFVRAQNMDIQEESRLVGFGRVHATIGSVVKSSEIIFGRQFDRDASKKLMYEDISKIKFQSFDMAHFEFLARNRFDDSGFLGNRQRLSGDLEHRVYRDWIASAGYAATLQSGTFVEESGLSRRQLANWSVGSKWKFVQARLTRGQDPGGTTCSAGSCTWLPPLNGTRASLSAGLTL